MKTATISEMEKGWFIGDFSPSLCKTNACEVAVKTYRAGDQESAHFHKVATEYTMVVSGRVCMFGREFQAGDIIIAEPGDVTDFKAVEDSVNVVVKIPGATGDKYPV